MVNLIVLELQSRFSLQENKLLDSHLTGFISVLYLFVTEERKVQENGPSAYGF